MLELAARGIQGYKNTVADGRKLCKGLAVVLICGYNDVQIFPSVLTYITLIHAGSAGRCRTSRWPFTWHYVCFGT